MRVILAEPPKREQSYDLSYPNLGIVYLIGYCRGRLKGLGVEFKYLEGFHNLRSHIEAVCEFRPDVYGLSFTTFTAELAYRTMTAVRDAMPQLPILCGGAHPTAAYEEVLARSPADLCICGEGEETFAEILTRYAEDKPVDESVRGIALRRNGSAFRAERRPLIRDLDSIPYPAWDLIDFRKYLGMHIKKAKPQTYVLASRGCPFDCVFCSNPVWKDQRPWVRLRSAQNIAGEVEMLYRRGVREIYLSADELNVRTDWVFEVAEAITALGHKDLYFQCNLRADNVTRDLARALRGMNLWLAHLGIESGNQATLDGIGKKVTLGQIISACERLKEAGVKVYGFVMAYHVWEDGEELRWETPKDVENTLRFVKGLFRRGLLDYMSWQVTTPMPGSRLWELVRKRGLLAEGRRGYDFHRPSIRLPGVSERDMARSIWQGILYKNMQALRSGAIGWRHTERIWRGVKEMLRIGR